MLVSRNTNTTLFFTSHVAKRLSWFVQCFDRSKNRSSSRDQSALQRVWYKPRLMIALARKYLSLSNGLSSLLPHALSWYEPKWVYRILWDTTQINVNDSHSTKVCATNRKERASVLFMIAQAFVEGSPLFRVDLICTNVKFSWFITAPE